MYLQAKQVGLARTIYIRCIYGIFGRKITKYTVIYGIYIRFWPTLKTRAKVGQPGQPLRHKATYTHTELE